jgi:hypothetical protein
MQSLDNIKRDIQRAVDNFKATGRPEDELKLLQVIVNSWNFVSEFQPTLICYWREYISKVYQVTLIRSIYTNAIS